jgi:para-aminobenzoate synthetase
MGSLGDSFEARRRVLFIDAFDSFTNNIIGMLQQSLNADITMVHINDEDVSNNIDEILCAFDAVVVGPGPGHPANPADVGIIDRLWRLSETQLLPVLGICLGFQSLCLNHGAKIARLNLARHGIVSSPKHLGTDIFAGIHGLEATQYHSLHAVLGDLDNRQAHWEPSTECPLLQPLAWDTSDELNGPILMGVRHVEKPFWGVQFHPESICTSQAGSKMIVNWWQSAQSWLAQRNRMTINGWSRALNGVQPAAVVTENGRAQSRLAHELRSICGTEDIFLRWGKHSATDMSPTALIDALGLGQEEVILLDSQGHARGRFSILGLVTPGKTMKVTYSVPNKTLSFGTSTSQMMSTPLASIDEVWPILQESLDIHSPRQEYSSRASTPGPEIMYTGLDRFVSGHLPEESPFWGGFMGYISYEAGLETIDVDLHASCAEGGIPDVNFAFIHRSIIIDHESSNIYIQSLLPGDWSWILNVGRMIDDTVSRAQLRTTTSRHSDSTVDDAIHDISLTKALSNAQIDRPMGENYRRKVLECQDYLKSGDSYELCLTDETEIKLRGTQIDAWNLYKRLRRNNPAPFGAYMRLSDVSIVGSSPERFLQWTREGRCQFRPIKGTVKKGPEMTREMAHEILGSSKERAENLMIVDLIRHDLCGVVGPDNSWVSKLMVVEEYETVYQLVSVIEGQLPSRSFDPDGARGIHVLKASLPPGSMTGAPKKRSCEILRDIECRPRGVYSGVLGYMDVGGAGDFSVVIRTAVRNNSASQSAHPTDTSNGLVHTNGFSGIQDSGYNTPQESHINGHSEHTEKWHVGAGGAVTIQSTDEGEFLEMETKASSVLSALFPKCAT